MAGRWRNPDRDWDMEIRRAYLLDLVEETLDAVLWYLDKLESGW